MAKFYASIQLEIEAENDEEAKEIIDEVVIDANQVLGVVDAWDDGAEEYFTDG